MIEIKSMEPAIVENIALHLTCVDSRLWILVWNLSNLSTII